MAYKVLVVEDDAFLVSAYRVKLTNEGIEVRTAGDGEEALVLLKSFAPDVIIMAATYTLGLERVLPTLKCGGGMGVLGLRLVETELEVVGIPTMNK